MRRHLIAAVFVSLICTRFGQTPLQPPGPPDAAPPTTHGWRCQGDGSFCHVYGPQGAEFTLPWRSIGHYTRFPGPAQLETHVTARCR